MKFTPPKSVLTNEEIILATFKQRAYAFIIDFACIGALYLITKLILLKLDINGLCIKEFASIKLEGYIPIEKVCSFIPVIYFTLITYFTNGKTIGKWILKIRVVSLYNPKISFKSSFERVLGYALGGIEVGLGFFQIFWTTNRMCLHDQLSETIVIHEKKNKELNL